MKHNKKRNTAFIYEVLTRELTKTILDKKTARKFKVLNILQEHFAPSTPLGQELRLYNTLLETRHTQTKVAERLLTETKAAYLRLEESTIFDAQSRVISAINKGLGQEIWSTFVPNFKALASVNGIFNAKTAIKKKVLFEQAIVDRMSTQPYQSTEASLDPLDNLTYNSFIHKFNEKYGPLLQEQKDLLNQYITSFADEGFEMRVFLNQELGRLKDSLQEALDQNRSTMVTNKITAVMDYLQDFQKREFKTGDLNRLLKTQALAQELLADD